MSEKAIAQELLQSWCDRLLNLQISEIWDERLFGGILCPACHRIHGAEQHGDDRLFRQVTAQTHIGADAVTAQHHLQQPAVAFHIAAGHGNIAVAIALSYKRAYLACGGFDLLKTVFRGDKLYCAVIGI